MQSARQAPRSSLRSCFPSCRPSLCTLGTPPPHRTAEPVAPNLYPTSLSKTCTPFLPPSDRTERFDSSFLWGSPGCRQRLVCSDCTVTCGLCEGVFCEGCLTEEKQHMQSCSSCDEVNMSGRPRHVSLDPSAPVAPFAPSTTHSLIQPPTFVRSPVRPFFRSPVRRFAGSPVRPFARSFARSFNHRPPTPYLKRYFVTYAGRAPPWRQQIKLSAR